MGNGQTDVIVGWANGKDANLWVKSNNFAQRNRPVQYNYLTMVAIAVGGQFGWMPKLMGFIR